MKKLSLFLFSIFFLSLFFVTPLFAQTEGWSDEGGVDGVPDQFETTESGSGSSITDKMRGALGGFDLPSTDNGRRTEVLIGRIIQVFLSIFGILFLGLMVYGGYKWMAAQGRDDEIQKAKDIIKSATTGVILVFISYAIAAFVISNITRNVTGPATSVEQTN